MDEGTACRAAGLAAPGEIHAADHAARDFIGVGVRISDQRVLAAEFEHHRLERIGGGLHYRAAGRHRADQRDHGNAGMGGERGAGFAAAGHDVEHTGWQKAADQFGKPQRG